jgi:ribosomal protein S18 acetylase RimI-like enzyme
VSAVGTEADLLGRIEAYFDAAPRAAADVEEHGALTLFVSRIPWRFYARPRLGLREDVGADDVAAVRARQRELGVREALEWVAETTPSLAGAAEAAGLEVTAVPLLALELADWSPPGRVGSVPVRTLAADDAALAAAYVTQHVAFAAGGTERGPAGPRERDRALADTIDLGFLRERIRRGLTAIAVAEDPLDGVLSSGAHNPAGDLTEIVGVGTLPSARRRGLGAAVTARLAEDARERGAALACLSATGDAVARVYERLGFRRVGTACFAHAPDA